jgi:hypothetical protein
MVEEIRSLVCDTIGAEIKKLCDYILKSRVRKVPCFPLRKYLESTQMYGRSTYIFIETTL